MYWWVIILCRFMFGRKKKCNNSIYLQARKSQKRLSSARFITIIQITLKSVSFETYDQQNQHPHTPQTTPHTPHTKHHTPKPHPTHTPTPHTPHPHPTHHTPHATYHTLHPTHHMPHTTSHHFTASHYSHQDIVFSQCTMYYANVYLSFIHLTILIVFLVWPFLLHVYHNYIAMCMI